MKNRLKTCANLASLLMVVPAWLLYQLTRVTLGVDEAFAGWSQAFSLIPGLGGSYLRRAFYRLVLKRCALDISLGFGTVLSHPGAKIGRRVYLGLFCSLGNVVIEDDVLVSSHVSIINGGRQHGIARLGIPIREQPGVLPQITIGRDSWIGERAVVMAAVGRHCVIGAGAVVVDPIPDYAVAVGVPARIIRYRDAAAHRANASSA